MVYNWSRMYEAQEQFREKWGEPDRVVLRVRGGKPREGGHVRFLPSGTEPIICWCVWNEKRQAFEYGERREYVSEVEILDVIYAEEE